MFYMNSELNKIIYYSETFVKVGHTFIPMFWIFNVKFVITKVNLLRDFIYLLEIIPTL